MNRLAKMFAAIAMIALVGGCIEIAHVDSFVSVPRDAVSFGVSNENER